MSILVLVIAVISVLVLAHCLLSLGLMLYAWDRPEHLRDTAGPAELRQSKFSFTALLPARGEELVIADTIARLWAAHYPRRLLEIVIICQRDDEATIAEATRQIEALDGDGIRLVIYDEPPFNKPHALQVGFDASSHDVIAVFDAEDDVHPDIFRVVNTVMINRGVNVVQGGVQLMNFRDHWFSTFNCLEYFFYYRSRMHFNARVGMVTLGGNTVFMRRSVLEQVGGWDQRCLTEDADIGVRLSALGEEIAVIYDRRWVTREETPATVRGFVKQRTRWHQGFLQILGRGVWRRIPGRRRRLLAMVTLAQPLLDAVLLFYLVLIPLSLIFVKLPDLVAILTFLPLYGVLLQLLMNMVGLILFCRCFEEQVPLGRLAAMPLTFLPFQWLIGFSAARAAARHVLGRGEWEKTEHRGAHRITMPRPSRAVAAGPGTLPEENAA